MIEEMKIRYDIAERCEENRHPSCNNKGNKTCSCIEIVIAILAALFIGVIGIIIGAALSVVILAALPAIIVLAVVLLVLLVLSIIIAICCRNKNKKSKKTCCCCSCK